MKTNIFFHEFSSKDLVEERDEAKEIETGPLSVLLQSVKQNTQVHKDLMRYCYFLPKTISRFAVNMYNLHISICNLDFFTLLG